MTKVTQDGPTALNYQPHRSDAALLKKPKSVVGMQLGFNVLHKRRLQLIELGPRFITFNGIHIIGLFYYSIITNRFVAQIYLIGGRINLEMLKSFFI